MPNPGRHLFFCRESDLAPVQSRLSHGYAWNVWRPELTDLHPPRAPRELRRRFMLRAAMHQARLLRGHGYGEIVIYSDNELVHHTGFAPRYWRFPFLGKDDIQIASAWTSPAHQEKGFAEFAIEKIIASARRPGRRFWYCVEDSNLASIRVAEKLGFSLIGIGTWVVPMGMELLSYYEILDSAQTGTCLRAEESMKLVVSA